MKVISQLFDLCAAHPFVAIFLVLVLGGIGEWLVTVVLAARGIQRPPTKWDDDD